MTGTINSIVSRYQKIVGRTDCTTYKIFPVLHNSPEEEKRLTLYPSIIDATMQLLQTYHSSEFPHIHISDIDMTELCFGCGTVLGWAFTKERRMDNIRDARIIKLWGTCSEDMQTAINMLSDRIEGLKV